jgi:hypothetical protein
VDGYAVGSRFGEYEIRGFRLAAIYFLAVATGLLTAYGLEYGGLNPGIWVGAILTLLLAVAEWTTNRRLLSVAVACSAGASLIFVAGLPLLDLRPCGSSLEVVRCAPPGSRERTLIAAALMVLSDGTLVFTAAVGLWSRMHVVGHRAGVGETSVGETNGVRR